MTSSHSVSSTLSFLWLTPSDIRATIVSFVVRTTGSAPSRPIIVKLFMSQNFDCCPSLLVPLSYRDSGCELFYLNIRLLQHERHKLAVLLYASVWSHQ